MKIITGLLALTLTLGLAACSHQMTTEEARVAYCQDLQDLRNTVAQIQQLGPTNTVADVKALRTQLRNDVKALRASAGNLQDPKVQNLLGTVDRLIAAVNDIPDTYTLEQARASIADEVAAVQQARTEVDMVSICQPTSHR